MLTQTMPDHRRLLMSRTTAMVTATMWLVSLVSISYLLNDVVFSSERQRVRGSNEIIALQQKGLQSPTQPESILPQPAQQQHHRHQFKGRILGEDVTRDFQPLTCNENISTTTCQPWSSKFGNNRKVYTARVMIACGECIIVDYNASRTTSNNLAVTNVLTFVDGIDIMGKLVFPDRYKVHIYTTFIVVQGVLEMTAIATPVTGVPNIRITMIGNTTTTSFTPIDNNAKACTAIECNVGKKAIVVAGGTVNSK
jgi:G8 domain